MQNVTPVVPITDDVSVYSSTLDQCLKVTNQFSGSLYQNICDGSQYFIPLGFWDYMVFISITTIITILTLAVLALFIALFKS